MHIAWFLGNMESFWVTANAMLCSLKSHLSIQISEEGKTKFEYTRIYKAAAFVYRNDESI